MTPSQKEKIEAAANRLYPNDTRTGNAHVSAFYFGAEFALTLSDDKEKRNGVIQECIEVIKDWEKNAPERFSDYHVIGDVITSLHNLKS